ncbi:MAG: asparaginase [Candidatus Aminicenantes bacterium]|nr:asparaginase [Candidatus Aminicenantes bacterium]
MKIRVFVTGGTFDKEYNELKGTLFFKDSHLQEMLRLGRCRLEVDIRTLMMIDSLDMTEADRMIVADNCRAATEDRILITHGTDTMVETAAFLAGRLSGKTIVLTGAMIPYKFGSSDGLFNLGSSLAFVQVLPPGVYISMNGKSFPWDRVRKDKRIGEFVEV